MPHQRCSHVGLASHSTHELLSFRTVHLCTWDAVGQTLLSSVSEFKTWQPKVTNQDGPCDAKCKLCAKPCRQPSSRVWGDGWPEFSIRIFRDLSTQFKLASQLLYLRVCLWDCWCVRASSLKLISFMLRYAFWALSAFLV